MNKKQYDSVLENSNLENMNIYTIFICHITLEVDMLFERL
jgi:hypothetical protein